MWKLLTYKLSGFGANWDFAILLQITPRLLKSCLNNNKQQLSDRKILERSFIEIQSSLLTLETAANLFNIHWNSYSYHTSFIHRSIHTVADSSLLVLVFLFQSEKNIAFMLVPQGLRQTNTVEFACNIYEYNKKTFHVSCMFSHTPSNLDNHWRYYMINLILRYGESGFPQAPFSFLSSVWHTESKGEAAQRWLMYPGGSHLAGCIINAIG